MVWEVSICLSAFSFVYFKEIVLWLQKYFWPVQKHVKPCKIIISLFIFVEFAQILSLLSSTHLGSVDDSSFTSTHISKKKGEQIFDLKKRALVKSGSCSPRKKKKKHILEVFHRNKSVQHLTGWRLKSGDVSSC